MGAQTSSQQVLMNNELLEFQKASTFNVKEINDLYYFFRQISVIQDDDGVIDF